MAFNLNGYELPDCFANHVFSDSDRLAADEVGGSLCQSKFDRPAVDIFEYSCIVSEVEDAFSTQG